MKKRLFQSRILGLLEARKLAFLVTFFVVVFFSYAFLYVVDFLPEAPATQNQTSNGQIEATDNEAVESGYNDQPSTESIFGVDPLPERIIFDSLNKTVPILNPTSDKVADLDNALLSGAVRHPDSADFSADGNIFILGHSSYLPNVFNKNFQAFNGIQSLTWGDLIRLQSSDSEYIYRVERVYKAKASDVVVPNTPGEAKLTLATCNSFASKDDRFIVEAVLVDTREL